MRRVTDLRPKPAREGLDRRALKRDIERRRPGEGGRTGPERDDRVEPKRSQDVQREPLGEVERGGAEPVQERPESAPPVPRFGEFTPDPVPPAG
jgi:hypothetical protein